MYRLPQAYSTCVSELFEILGGLKPKPEVEIIMRHSVNSYEFLNTYTNSYLPGVSSEA
jgi:hypothetical protein